MAEEKIGLTVFLRKAEKVTALEKALLGPGKVAIPLRDPLSGMFLPFPATEENEPSWVQSVKSIIRAPIVGDMGNKSPAGMLIVRREEKNFAVTFGHAWLKLDDSWKEPDFGLLVALNAIPKDSLVEIKAEQVFAKFHLANERAPKASPISSFGVEFDRDLVGAVEGEPKRQPSLGKIIRGGTSLRLHLPIASLAQALDDSAALFASEQYKSDWPEIGNMRPVSNDLLVRNLEEYLDKDIVNGLAGNRISLFTPTQRREDSLYANSYVYGRWSKEPSSTPYLSYSGWLNFLKGQKAIPCVAQAKASPVHMVDESGASMKKVSVFECFGYETSFAGRIYILSSGTWYEVVEHFRKRIEDAIKHIPKGSACLPKWDGKEHEDKYNERCGNVSPFLNCDRKIILYGGNQSKFEFCDLVNLADSTLFFSKIVLKSSGMSHFVEQIRRTTELLHSADGAFREKASMMLRKHHQKTNVPWLKARPRNGDIRLCMVSIGKDAKDLPFSQSVHWPSSTRN